MDLIGLSLMQRTSDILNFDISKTLISRKFIFLFAIAYLFIINLKILCRRVFIKNFVTRIFFGEKNEFFWRNRQL